MLSAPMNWTGEYIIEADGLCHWHESLRISDPQLVAACRENPPTRFFFETWAHLGVTVGVA